MKNLVLLSLAVVAANVARAQSLPPRFTGLGVAYGTQLVMRYQGEIQRQTGTLLGAAGTVSLGPLEVALTGLTGTLRPSASTPSNPERTLYTTTVAVYLRLAGPVAIGAEAEARRYETAVGTAWARLLGASLSLNVPLGLAGIEGNAVIDYLPLASASGSDTVSLAVRATFGITYAPPRLPMLIRASYRLERYDYRAAGVLPARLEQFDGIVIGAGLRLGK